MKNAAIIVLLLTTVIFGSLYLGQRRKALDAENILATERQDREQLASRVAKQEERAETLQSKLHDTRAKAVEKADQVSQLEQALTNQVAADSKKSSPMAQMFKNPEMRELIKTQQKVALSSMMEKNYGPFSSALGLTPEQTAGLKELVVKKSLIDAQMGISMMSGDADPEKRKELVQQAKTDKDAVNEEIKAYLGDEAYTQFQTYEKTLPERMSIGMFKDQVASGPNALAPDQEAQLVQSMTQIRQNFKFSTDFYDQSKYSGGDLESIFTEERISQFEQEREQLDQQYLAEAQKILATNQIPPFEKFLSSQRELQKTGMKMAQGLFGSKPASK